ncbi:SET domain protein [Niveomyces insectorum RCEF 264]|uniref:SET domain protein n=1 Tax=Niveomyces insectorum RCEF 264 TaxID=1081102 RepID=A0A162MRB4_9HYPO|nr:SET domain protein [Niveomyces insectorum RCEF 264]
MAALAFVWTNVLILIAVLTASGNGSQNERSKRAPGGPLTRNKDAGWTHTIKATDHVHMNGTCRSGTGSHGVPLVLGGSSSSSSSSSHHRHGACPLPLAVAAADDNITLSAWAPWTHRPVCTDARQDEWGAVQQHCVFTDATFRGGRGISVIAAPHVAAAMADTLDDGGIPARLRDHPSTPLAGDPTLEHGPPAAEGGNASFTVQTLPNRGKGVVATRRIRKGELVFVDYVTVLSQNTFTAPGSSDAPADPEQILQLLQVAVQQLTPGQQARVHALAHSLGGERIRDILRTNVFGGIEIAGEPHIGLFPLGSRINHNCQPNTYWRYTPGYLSQEVIALRDIERGEEVTHSYIPLGVVYEERQEQINGWGFRCTCPLCTAPPAQRALSDQRRRRLHAIHGELSATSASATAGYSTADRATRLAEMVDEMEFLVEKEQIWPALCDYYLVATQAFLDVDDFAGARRYWHAASDAWDTYAGEQHENVDTLRDLWKAITARESAVEAAAAAA